MRLPSATRQKASQQRDVQPTQDRAVKRPRPKLVARAEASEVQDLLGALRPVPSTTFAAAPAFAALQASEAARAAAADYGAGSQVEDAAQAKDWKSWISGLKRKISVDEAKRAAAEAAMKARNRVQQPAAPQPAAKAEVSEVADIFGDISLDIGGSLVPPGQSTKSGDRTLFGAHREANDQPVGDGVGFFCGLACYVCLVNQCLPSMHNNQMSLRHVDICLARACIQSKHLTTCVLACAHAHAPMLA